MRPRSSPGNWGPDMRVLGLDLGTVRTGVALSDPTGCIASPHSTLSCEGRRRDLQSVADLVDLTGAERVVVGMPTNLRGEAGPAAQAASEFVSALSEILDVPVTTWDERMTTVVAERSLIEAGERRESRREVRDKVAAAVMLQGYLDAQANLDAAD